MTKIFGREPTLYIAVLNAVVMFLSTIGLHLLTGKEGALIVIAINGVFACFTAWAVRPISPAIFTYAVGAILAVFSAYGLAIPIETAAMLNALVITVLALVTRGQVSPQDTAVSKA